MVALQLFIGRTRLGRSMRSTAADRDAAALMGVNINRTIAITFLIGSALAGAAGVVYGLQYGVATLQRRLPGRPQGVHRRRPRRHRQHGRRRARRLHHRLHRGRRRRRGLRPLGPGHRVRHPRHRARVPARPASSASSWESAHERRGGPPRQAARAEPVRPARAPQRDRSPPPVVDDPRRAWSLVGVGPAADRPVPAVHARPDAQTPGSTASPTPACSSCWRSGLNLVVGVAGLLDLGYAAFFAIGAYTYAYVASPFGNSILGIDILGALGGRRRGHRLLADAPRRRGRRGAVRHPARRADPPPARRLPRHRDPRLRRDRPDRVPQLGQGHQRHQRDRRPRAAGAADHRRLLGHRPVALLHHRRCSS